MANQLTLVQVSPPSNPDTMFVKCAVSGNYVNGTPDPLPLQNILDPQIIGAIPMTNTNLSVTPAIFNSNCGGYYPQVQRSVTNGVTSFGLRWFQLSTGGELVSEAFPAAITGGEVFLEIKVNLAQQS